MTILAWYSLLMLCLGAFMNIADIEKSSKQRLFGVLVALPIIIFLCLYLFRR